MNELCTDESARTSTLPLWIEEELAGCQWPDKRLGKRACKLLDAMSRQPQSTFPQCCGDAAQTKAAYRFFDHAELDFASLLEGHYQASWQRISQSADPVLLLEDSTAMNFEGRPATQGLGPIGTRADGAQGLWLHSTLAMSQEGCCLGFVHAQCWVRDATKAGRRHQRHQRELEDKESYRWVSSLHCIAQQARQRAAQVPLIRITDREGDLWAVLVEAHRRGQADEPLHVLMRSRHDRQVRASAGQPQGSLWTLLSQGACAATQSLALPARGAKEGKAARAARQAVLEVRYTAVHVLAATQSAKGDPAGVDCWAVEALETEPPAGCEPLHWRLLTTWPVRDAQQALEVLRWYSVRWQIEVMHKVLKSGLGIEQRALRTEERLEAVLALSLIVAWRIMNLMHAGRQERSRPASEVLERDECLLLQVIRQHKGRCKDSESGEVLSARQAMEEIARLGGWLGRKRDPPPGIVVLWRGMQCLDAQLQGFQLAVRLMGNR